MDPVGKAIWFIESHFASEMTLEEIADAGGLSRFGMSRAFGQATGHSVMRYVRGRRLSEAARSLAAGAPDIMAVALDVGYGSHEAFTRAFRDQFGLTPEALRARRHLDKLALVEAIRMDDLPVVELQPPRFENGRALLIAGMMERYSFETCQRIPLQWQRFAPHIGHVPGQVGRVACGVRSNFDEAGTLDYLSGVEVASFEGLPDELDRLRIPAHRYAVFLHRDHVSTIRATFHAIWSRWQAQSGHKIADAPDFERYGEQFDPERGTGGVEIWVPIEG